MTCGKIAAAGALSRLWIVLFVGIAFSLVGDRNQLGLLLTIPLLGAEFGLVWNQLGYRTAPTSGPIPTARARPRPRLWDGD